MNPPLLPPRKFPTLGATRAMLFIALLAAAPTILSTATAAASNHYTEKQLAVLEERVGKTYWIKSVDGRTPAFLSAPDARARSFPTRTGESFEIVELVGRKQKNPYFRAKFDSGKEGYLRPEAFLEEFNLTLLTVDPLANEKRKAAEEAEEEKKRVDWINSQPWPAAAKEAALKGNPVPGMTFNEVKKIAGAPSRVAKVQTRSTTPEEHWFYRDGKQLIFHQGLLSRIILREVKSP
jgi:hypothetical protein